MKPTPLRRRLLVLVAAGILPLAAISVASLLVLSAWQRTQADRAGIDIARALSTAVDFEHRRSIAVLEALGTSVALEAGDVEAFRPRAQRILAIRPEWEAIVVADATGRVVLRAPAGPELAAAELASLAKVARDRKPVVGDLVKGPAGIFHILVAVPVVTGEKLAWVLAAAVKPEAFLEPVRRQRVPNDWIISVFDASGSRVARSRANARYLGTPAAPSLLDLMSSGGETGTGVTYTLEGQRTYTAYVRLQPSGWSVAIGLPPSLVETGEWRSLALLGGGILLALAVGAVVARSVDRGIVRPMAGLREAARALGARRTVVAPATTIEEIDQVASALVAAAEEHARAEREREELLDREREARAAAEAASGAKDQFLAMLGHELRNPLGAIANASHLLSRRRRIARSRRSRARGSSSAIVCTAISLPSGSWRTSRVSNRRS